MPVPPERRLVAGSERSNCLCGCGVGTPPCFRVWKGVTPRNPVRSSRLEALKFGFKNKIHPPHPVRRSTTTVSEDHRKTVVGLSKDQRRTNEGPYGLIVFNLRITKRLSRKWWNGHKWPYLRQFLFSEEPLIVAEPSPFVVQTLGWSIMRQGSYRIAGPRVAAWRDDASDYFPMQNWLKIMSSRSSVVVWPTISPTALTAMRSSPAASSRVSPARNTSSVRCVAARARVRAS